MICKRLNHGTIGGLLAATLCLAGHLCAFAVELPARPVAGPPPSAEADARARQVRRGAPVGEQGRFPANAMEPMAGPDAWELFHMGPFGLVHRGGDGPPRGGPGMRLNAFEQHQRELEQRLGVTAAQHARIEAILNREEQAGALQRRKLEGAVRELQGMLRSATATRAAIELKIDAVARLRTALTKSRLHALLDTRGVLTAAQRAKLQTLADDFVPRAGPPR